MEAPLLRDPQQFPSEEVLQPILANSYPVFEELMKLVSAPEYGLVPEWNYYKDGKAWLCKVCYKKKTIFWLSAWDNLFKTTFYYTEKTNSGIAALAIDEKIKEDFTNSKSFGKFMPLTLEIVRREQLKDLLKIVEYKKSLK